MNKKKNLDAVEISDGAGVYDIKIILGNGILDNNELEWHKRGDLYLGEVKERCLTLKEIYQQIKAKGHEEVIYVWEEGPLGGTIYICGNYNEGQWVEHGTTRGYA